MNRRELLAAMLAAASTPAAGKIPFLPPALEEMVEIELRLTPHMQQTIRDLALAWNMTENEVVADCLREMIAVRKRHPD
jgi:hypothetical protein